jgi:hypothetical protein
VWSTLISRKEPKKCSLLVSYQLRVSVSSSPPACNTELRKSGETRGTEVAERVSHSGGGRQAESQLCFQLFDFLESLQHLLLIL